MIQNIFSRGSFKSFCNNLREIGVSTEPKYWSTFHIFGEFSTITVANGTGLIALRLH